MSQVEEFDRIEGAKKKYRRRRDFKFLGSLVYCSQCNRKFDGNIAKIQIENKRENAPICIPCIMGRPRKPFEGQKGIIKDKETIKRYKEYSKKYGHKH